MRILKALLLTVSTLVCAPALHAQDFALKAGMAISSFEADDEFRYTESTIAPFYGGHFRLKFGPLWLQPEVNVMTRGGRASSGETSERVRLQYFEVAGLLVVPVTVGRLGPYAFAGPHAAVEVHCRHIIEEQGLKTNQGCEGAAESVFLRRSVDYGMTGGAGVSYPLGGGRLLLEGRYTHGMANISEDPVIDRVTNRTWVLALGFTFDTREPGR